MDVLKKYPIVSLALTIATVLLGSLVAGEASVLSGIFIQLGLCADENFICIGAYQVGISVAILILGVIGQVIYDWRTKKKRLDKKPSEPFPKLGIYCGIGEPYEYRFRQGTAVRLEAGKKDMSWINATSVISSASTDMVSSLEHDKPDAMEFQLVRIKVENESDKTIKNVRVQLVEIIPSDAHWLPVNLHLKDDNPPNNQPFKASTTLNPKQPEFFDVAQMKSAIRAGIKQRYAIEIQHTVLGVSHVLSNWQYGLTIMASGEDMEPCKRTLFLSVDSEGYLRLRETHETAEQTTG